MSMKVEYWLVSWVDHIEKVQYVLSRNHDPTARTDKKAKVVNVIGREEAPVVPDIDAIVSQALNCTPMQLTPDRF
jgi:hypothetical protein